MKVLRIGVLGLASIARRSILPALFEMRHHFEVVGLATRSVDDARERNPELSADLLMTYEELLSYPDLDAVYIPLPTGLHHDWVCKFLERGTSVLCEKSVGTSLAEVADMVRLAESKNLVLLENFQFQFHSQFDFLRSFVESERLGDCRCLRASFGFPPFSDKTNIRYVKDLGGGALLDAGAYTTKVSQLLLGENLEVVAANLQSTPDHEVDIWGSATLRAQNGVTAQLSFGFDNAYRCGVEVWGSKGYLSTNRLYTARPEFEPTFYLESSDGPQTLKLEPDNHFHRMLERFYELTEDEALRREENARTLDQARLLTDIQVMSKI